MCILSQLKDNNPCLLENAKLEEDQIPLTKACGARMKRPGRHREGGLFFKRLKWSEALVTSLPLENLKSKLFPVEMSLLPTSFQGAL